MGREFFLLFLLALGISHASASTSSGPMLQVDLCTQYLPPWGGQGLNAVSDAFPPGQVVKLETNVTFRGDAVAGKPVSYTIKAPDGETFSATSFTQANGVAICEYLLPTQKNCFGTWTVKASVDVAGTTASDALCFLVSWLVEVDVEASPIAYKGEIVTVDTTLTRVCMQDPRQIMNVLLKDSNGKPVTDNDLLLCIAVNDELGQVVGASKLNMPTTTGLGGYDLGNFVRTTGADWIGHERVILTRYTKLANTAVDGILIPTWSFSGRATIRANIVTKSSGIAYCPGCSSYVWIWKGQ
jgi:hypothetical protein